MPGVRLVVPLRCRFDENDRCHNIEPDVPPEIDALQWQRVSDDDSGRWEIELLNPITQEAQQALADWDCHLKSDGVLPARSVRFCGRTRLGEVKSRKEMGLLDGPSR